jgi:putative ABC transport system ATP-binding protein
MGLLPEKEQEVTASMDNTPVMLFRDVVKVYPLPAGDVTALDGVSFQVDRGEFISVMGPSGSGKSTLLNLMGCLDPPTSGEIYISGTRIGDMSDTELTSLRRDRIGFIFQYFNLFPLLNIIENVTFPMMLKTGRGVDPERGKEVLRAVQLDDSLFTHTPTEISGGQQQRVAIARALINNPDILLCDEPTGNLDSKTGAGIMELMTELNRKGTTIIMVTHDPTIAQYSRRTIRIADGRIVS